MKIFKKPKVRKAITFVVIIIAIIVLALVIVGGRHYFSKRSIRQIGREISIFGIFSPLVVVFLIFISTIIPPLPLPIPLIEIASGVLFGFMYGFIIVWASQIISSLVAFKAAKTLKKRFFGKLLDNKIWNSYKDYLAESGPKGVFLIRLTLASPFNIISYLSGLTDMKIREFALATALGTIPEALLFSFVGSELKNIHISLWYLFIAIIVLGAIGSVATILIMRRSKGAKK